MPVPVPCIPRQPAHPVIKPPRLSDNGGNNSFRNLTHTLPVSPTGPPPSFGTREQWINSLPSWRRSKPRRIWEEDSHHPSRIGVDQDFHQGLAVADNVAAIKGPHAEACIPPLSSPQYVNPVHMQRDMQIYPPRLIVHRDSDASLAEPRAHFIGNTAVEMDVNYHLASGEEAEDVASEDVYGSGSFTPFYEDDSPGGREGGHLGSSPMEPVTPFGEYVDQAIAPAPLTVPYDEGIYRNEAPIQSYPYGCVDDKCGTRWALPPPAMQMPQEPVPAPAAVPELVTPTATAGYRRLSEPLSEWIANFVWKVCTTGSNLPPFVPRPTLSPTKVHAVSPPSYLATSVHSLLLSTLLQPSAIFLALWYIIKLPVYFGNVGLTADHVKELRFRLALLGDGRDREAENNAPFRVIVLGCMLANKWLDDHTFSNKTWHSISNIPVQTLNKLESLALDIFSYDLSISSQEWSQWLSHVMSYHQSLTSPSHPQPISRPSSNPSLIIRMAIDEIIQAPTACGFDPKNPQPVFIGIEERRKERIQKDKALAVESIELDLDDDGPLREEYVPKRRVSNAHPVRTNYRMEDRQPSWEMGQSAGKCLPPPARWSPAGDEPILRESNRPYGRYVAVQPTPIPTYNGYPAIPSYQPIREGYQSHWPMFSAYSSAEVQPMIGYSYEMPNIQQPPPPPAYNHCGPLLIPHHQIAMSHSRSQSLSHDQDISQSRNHIRSFSQSSRMDTRGPNHDGHHHMPAPGVEIPLAPAHQVTDMRWGPRPLTYHPAGFAPPPLYTWLRT
ncbi:hypothetical protein VNI00_001009 [Paramarasmius palmivorus]|uniref:Cyclin N-terminal domain-containing protein n=1 Tax=Paramarasmius palmivorus TaxID=297713 RepID=A0AAW0E8B0_9AGAR